MLFCMDATRKCVSEHCAHANGGLSSGRNDVPCSHEAAHICACCRSIANVDHLNADLCHEQAWVASQPPDPPKPYTDYEPKVPSTQANARDPGVLITWHNFSDMCHSLHLDRATQLPKPPTDWERVAVPDLHSEADIQLVIGKYVYVPLSAMSRMLHGQSVQGWRTGKSPGMDSDNVLVIDGVTLATGQMLHSLLHSCRWCPACCLAADTHILQGDGL